MDRIPVNTEVWFAGVQGVPVRTQIRRICDNGRSYKLFGQVFPFDRSIVFLSERDCWQSIVNAKAAQAIGMMQQAEHIAETNGCRKPDQRSDGFYLKGYFKCRQITLDAAHDALFGCGYLTSEQAKGIMETIIGTIEKKEQEYEARLQQNQGAD